MVFFQIFLVFLSVIEAVGCAKCFHIKAIEKLRSKDQVLFILQQPFRCMSHRIFQEFRKSEECPCVLSQQNVKTVDVCCWFIVCKSESFSGPSVHQRFLVDFWSKQFIPWYKVFQLDMFVLFLGRSSWIYVTPWRERKCSVERKACLFRKSTGRSFS